MMSKKKSSAAKAAPVEPRKATPSPKKGPSKTVLIIGVLAAVVVVTALAASGQSGSESGVPSPSPEEAKYLDRYLPEGYSAPQIVKDGKVSATVKMTPTTANVTESEVTIPVADVSARKIVSFEYVKNESETLPMLAYVRPSGKVFVGVSYCVPCRGTGQWLDGDGTLTCESCGTKRDPETGVGISGSCKLYPLDELPVIVSGDNIVIERSALDAWTVQPIDRQVGG